MKRTELKGGQTVVVEIRVGRAVLVKQAKGREAEEDKS
jgi:hypothetical protein